MITPKKYINKQGWFCYETSKGSFKISCPFELMPEDVKQIYRKKVGTDIKFNHYSLFL